MATRSLTEIFILMRNNALQSRNIFSEQVSKRRSQLSQEENDDHRVGDHRKSRAISCSFVVDGLSVDSLIVIDFAKSRKCTISVWLLSWLVA